MVSNGSTKTEKVFDKLLGRVVPMFLGLSLRFVILYILVGLIPASAWKYILPSLSVGISLIHTLSGKNMFTNRVDEMYRN